MPSPVVLVPAAPRPPSYLRAWEARLAADAWHTATVKGEPLARDEVLRARQRTIGCRSARTTFHVEGPSAAAVIPDEPPESPECSATRPHVARLAHRMLFGPMRRRLRALDETMREGSVGLIDFDSHRCVQQYPGQSKAELVIGARRWYAAPGTAVARCKVRAPSSMQPLWLVDLVGGLADAREDGSGDVDGRRCRRFSAHADLDRADRALPYEMARPDNAQTVLSHISITVWIDEDGHIRRIQHNATATQAQTVTTTVNLSALGIALPTDWSRIPRVL